MTFRRRVYLTLDPTEKGGIAERIFEILLIAIILLNILAIILSSVKEIDQKYDAYFRDFEIFSLVFFTVEYIGRIYSIVEKPEYSDPIKGRLRFMRYSTGAR